MAFKECVDTLVLQDEVAKANKEINEAANSILDEINSLDLDDALAEAAALLAQMDIVLKAANTKNIASLGELSDLIKSPNSSDPNDDISRLNALGFASINKVLWLSDESSNIRNLRILYYALDRDLSRVKQALSGDFGDFFVVTSIPEIKKFTSSTSKHLTLEELTALVGFTVFKEDILQVKSGTDFITYVKTNKFLAIDKSIGNMAELEGVSEEVINIKLFSLSSSILTPFYNNKLVKLGLSEAQIASANGFSIFDIDSVLSNLSTVQQKVEMDALQEIDIVAIKELLLETLEDLNFIFVEVDPLTISKLTTLNTENDIETLLVNKDSSITGVVLDSNQSAILDEVEKAQSVDPGSFTISNKLLAQPDSNKARLVIKVLNLLSLADLLSAGTTTGVSDLAAANLDAQAEASSLDEVFSAGEPSQSFDSPNDLLVRNMDYDKTFSTFDTIDSMSSDSLTDIQTLNVEMTQSLLGVSLQATFKVTRALSSKTGSFLKDLEAMTSFAASLSGKGNFENSFIKCSFGLDIDLNFNPIANLLNFLGVKINEAVDKINQMVRRLIDELINKVFCLIENLLPDIAIKANLGVCKVKTPDLGQLELNLAPLIQQIVTLKKMYKLQASSLSFMKISVSKINFDFDILRETSNGCDLFEDVFGAFSFF